VPVALSFPVPQVSTLEREEYGVGLTVRAVTRPVDLIPEVTAVSGASVPKPVQKAAITFSCIDPRKNHEELENHRQALAREDRWHWGYASGRNPHLLTSPAGVNPIFAHQTLRIYAQAAQKARQHVAVSTANFMLHPDHCKAIETGIDCMTLEEGVTLFIRSYLKVRNDHPGVFLGHPAVWVYEVDTRTSQIRQPQAYHQAIPLWDQLVPLDDRYCQALKLWKAY
jgi:hypothetical protein